MTQTISKSKLKANMLRIFREIEENGEGVIVTDHNRPTLVIHPIARKRSMDEIFGKWRGKVTFYEDPDTPTSDEWDDVA